MSEITIEEFLKQKLTNFILYLEKTIGTKNELYPQVKQLQENSKALISYAEYLSKAAKMNPTTKKYEFEESVIVEYLENNKFKKIDLAKLDNSNFLHKLQRYLELFVNVIC